MQPQRNELYLSLRHFNLCQTLTNQQMSSACLGISYEGQPCLARHARCHVNHRTRGEGWSSVVRLVEGKLVCGSRLQLAENRDSDSIVLGMGLGCTFADAGLGEAIVPLVTPFIAGIRLSSHMKKNAWLTLAPTSRELVYFRMRSAMLT